MIDPSPAALFTGHSSSECSKILARLNNTAQNSTEMPVRTLINYKDYFALILSEIINLSFL